jgi:hypothetical protein
MFLEEKMFLKQRSNGHLLEIMDVSDLFNLLHEEILARSHSGEEVQDPEMFKKSDLIFLSGEELPRCWTDPHYRDDKIKRFRTSG